MTRTRARAVAWTAAAVSVVLAVVDTAITAAHAPLMSEETWAVHGWPLATLATVGCSLMGALILSTYPRHPIGWLLLVAGTASISLATEAYAIWVLDDEGPGPESAGHLAAWVSLLFNAPMAITAITLIFLTAPHGHLPSRRWRWAAGVTITGLAMYTIGVLLSPPGEAVIGEQTGDSAQIGLLTSVGILLVAIGLIASAVSLVRRLRRARDETRRQLLWIASSAAFLALGFALVLVVSSIQQEQTFVAAIPLFTAYLALPVCTAVAVLRYRLFDIDLIVNRALVVALATGLVATGYVTVVVLVGAAVGRGFWPSLVATALVAMAFQPLRRRVSRVADRVAFGTAAAPYEALAEFSRRVGGSPDPAALLPAVAEAATDAVAARSATARLVVPGAPDRVAAWPPEAMRRGVPGTVVELAVVDRGERLGALDVEMPAGRAPRRREHDLLQNLADQAAIGFRNARLSAELSEQVRQLTRRTAELTESRRRLITAGDVERSRLERAIARTVLPHLAPLPARLDELAGAGADGVAALPPGGLVAAAGAALEALREITRGIFPAQLVRSGLSAALRSDLGRRGGRLVVGEDVVGLRFHPKVEAAAYFCASEAVREMGDPVEVNLSAPGDRLELTVTGTDPGELTLALLGDRVEAAGGTVTTERSGQAFRLRVGLPAARPDQGPWEGSPQTDARISGANADLVT